MFVGYGMLLVVPLIGLTTNWNILVVLILTERIGKSLRNPAKSTVLSSHTTTLIIIGMMIFGMVMGTHETIMRSAIADITPFHKRGTGYGVFNTAYGLALLGGAALIGLFYDLNQTGLIIALTFTAELVAIVLYYKMNQMVKNSR
jgi:MFS family permease